jgi:hypothetical protein
MRNVSDGSCKDNKNTYFMFNNVFTALTHYCASDKNKKNEMDGACSACGEGRGVYRVLVGKPEGKRPVGRPTRR